MHYILGFLSFLYLLHVIKPSRFLESIHERNILDIENILVLLYSF